MTAVVFTSIGVTDAIDILGGARGTATAWYIGWGTGGSGTGATATAGDVDLAAFATNSEGNVLGRASATSESQPASHQLQWKRKLTHTGAGSKGFEEVGLYIADAGGSSTSTSTTMWVRGNYGTVTTASDDSIEFTITLSAS